MSDEDARKKQPRTLAELAKLLDDPESGFNEAEAEIARIVLSPRALAMRRRREIEYMMYLGYSDHDILASLLLDPERRVLLSGLTSKRSVDQLREEMNKIREAREKDSVATAVDDTDKMYARVQEEMLKSFPAIEQQHKRPAMEALVQITEKRARSRGAIYDKPGAAPQPVRRSGRNRPQGSAPPVDRKNGDVAEGEFDPIEAMRGYQVDESAPSAQDSQ